jgi:DNA recombination protein RmuC
MEYIFAIIVLGFLVLAVFVIFKQNKKISDLQSVVNDLNVKKELWETKEKDFEELQDKLKGEIEKNIELEKNISAKEEENKGLKEDVINFEKQVDGLKEEVKSLNEKLALYKENLGREEEKNKALENKLLELKKQQEENEEVLLTKIENITKKILETGKNELTTANKQKLEDLLVPLKEKIEDFKKSVEEKQRFEHTQFTSLAERIKMLADLSTNLQQEAKNLTNALKGQVKTQGNWGEIQVKLLLERVGLQEDIHYKEQEVFNSTDEDEGRKKQIPDFIVYFPDNRAIVIDSKVTLNSVDEWFAAEDAEAQKKAADRVYISVKKHIDELAKKKYEDIHKIPQPDFVLMFLPVEAAFSIAMSVDNNLYNYAYEKKVIIVTPTTLLAVLSTVAYIWRQEEQKEKIEKIIRQVTDLYEKFVGFTEDFRKIGSSLNSAAKTYNSALNKLSEGRGNLIGRFEKIKDYAKLNTKKSTPEIEESNEDIKGLKSSNNNELE